MRLADPAGWIFDLDGTLTVPQHDFDAIKDKLGLPLDHAVLEGIASRPLAERAALTAAVHEWENELAGVAIPNPGARALLESLVGIPLGVLTRNSRASALRTLHSAGLADLVPPARVIGRDDAPPKPAPDGIRRLLEEFGLGPHEVWFVGDGLFDLRAARAAGVASVWLDLDGNAAHAHLADLVVRDLWALVPARRWGHLPNLGRPA